MRFKQIALRGIPFLLMFLILTGCSTDSAVSPLAPENQPAPNETTKSDQDQIAGIDDQHHGNIVVPNAPSNLRVTAMDPMPRNLKAGVHLNWQDNANNEAGFVLERRCTLNERWVVCKRLDRNTTSYLDRTVCNNRSYFYRIRAWNLHGSSDYSTSVGVSIGHGVRVRKPSI